MRVLVTGAAGFIGFHLGRRLLADGHEVDGFDGMTPYYDVRLKQARWAELCRSAEAFAAASRCSRTPRRSTPSPTRPSPT